MNTYLTVVHKNHLLFTGISFTFISGIGSWKLRKVRIGNENKITAEMYTRISNCELKSIKNPFDDTEI